MMGATEGKSILAISRAVIPYLLCTLGLVVVISAYPQIVLFLPSLAGR